MKKIKVFLVDNDEDELLFMKDGFESTGLFDVIGIASDGEELFERITHPPLPDLIVSDFNMPRKNGIDIAKGIHNNRAFSHIRVILLSISQPISFKQQFPDAGAHAYFAKPEKFNEYDPFARKIYDKVVLNLI